MADKCFSHAIPHLAAISSRTSGIRGVGRGRTKAAGYNPPMEKGNGVGSALSGQKTLPDPCSPILWRPGWDLSSTLLLSLSFGSPPGTRLGGRIGGTA